MAQSKITLIGMEQYLNPDHSVFESLDLPDGINKDTLIGTILLRCQEFELLYSDPDFMIAAVNVWGKKNYWTFDRWVKLINKEYDPLYNKDYYEEWTDTHEGEYSKEGSESASGNTKQTNNLLETDDHSMINDLTDSNDNTITHSEKAFNDSSFVNTTKDEIDQEQNHTGTVRNSGTTANTGTIQNQFGNTGSNDESGDDSYTNEHSYHGYGNIGITSAQELFLREANDVAVWNMYEHIADIFCKEFCIMIY